MSLRHEVGLCACLLVGCGGDVELPSDRLWTSAHFRYHTRSTNTETCPDILALLEQHGDVIHQALGLSWDPGEVIDYYDFDDAMDFAAHAGCEGFADGCTVGASVRSFVPFHDHELIHAYLAKVGQPPPFLQEGVAVALSCELYRLAPHAPPTVAWREAFTSKLDDPSEALFVGGGWLVSRILATRDPHLLVDLYRASGGPAASPDDFAAAFARVYATTLDDAWADALRAPGGTLFCPWQCSRPALPMDGSQVVLGSVCGQSTDQRTLMLAQDSDTVWSGSGETQFNIRNCNHLSALEGDPLAFGTTPTFGAVLSLGMGEYYLDRQIRSGPVTFAAQIAPQPLVSSTCTGATSVTVDPSAAFFYVRFRPAAMGQSITLSASSPRVMTAGLSNGPDGNVNICPACGVNPSQCVPLATRVAPATPDIGFTLSSDSVISIQPDAGVLVSLWPPANAR